MAYCEDQDWDCAFFQGTSLHVRGGRFLHDSWTITCFPDSVSLLCPVQSVPSGYSSLPWPHPTEHYYSSFNTQLWPCTSLPSLALWQWAWVFSDLGSQPTVAFPISSWWSDSSVLGLCTPVNWILRKRQTRIFYFRGQWRGLEMWTGPALYGLNSASTAYQWVTLGMIFTLCMSCFDYFGPRPHTCRILVPWPGDLLLEARQSLNHIGPLGKDWFGSFKSELIMIVTS